MPLTACSCRRRSPHIRLVFLTQTSTLLRDSDGCGSNFPGWRLGGVARVRCRWWWRQRLRPRGALGGAPSEVLSVGVTRGESCKTRVAGKTNPAPKNVVRHARRAHPCCAVFRTTYWRGCGGLIVMIIFIFPLFFCLYSRPARFWSVKRIDPFGDPSVHVSDDRLRSRLKAELGRSATTTLLVRSFPCWNQGADQAMPAV